MMKNSISRRAALRALGAAAFLPLAANAYEVLQPLAGDIASLRFKAIRIDVSPLVANGNAPAAAWLEQDLPGPLQSALAGRMSPHDPRAVVLLVRIDLITLGSHHSIDAGFGGIGSDATDDVRGAAVILGANGRPIATYPVSTVVEAYTGQSAFDLTRQRYRVATLAQSFAYFLPGQLGL